MAFELSAPQRLGRTVVLGYCDIGAAGIREYYTCIVVEVLYSTCRMQKAAVLEMQIQLGIPVCKYEVLCTRRDSRATACDVVTVLSVCIGAPEL